MKTRIILVCIAVMVIEAWAQTKPVLDDFDIVGMGRCPDNSALPCYLISNGTMVYIVKGVGYGKEEVIWQVQGDTLKVVWTKPKELI